MPPKTNKATATKASAPSFPQMPDLDEFAAFDLDEGEEKVSSSEVEAVLAEVLSEGRTKPQPVRPAAVQQAPKAVMQQPRPPASAPAKRLHDRVDERLHAFQAAAVAANQAGRKEEALHWLRVSKEFTKALEALLADKFPPPSERGFHVSQQLASAPCSDRSRAASDAALDPAAVVFPTAPTHGSASVELPAAPTTTSGGGVVHAGEAHAAVAAAQQLLAELDAEAVSAAEEEEAEEAEEEEETPGAVPAAAVATDASVDDADAAFAHLVSLRVCDFERTRVAGDAVALAALQRRRATLETLERRRGVAAAGAGAAVAVEYAGRLDAAIAEEKSRSREAKLSGQTTEALNALRRAKIMVEERESLGVDDSPSAATRQ